MFFFNPCCHRCNNCQACKPVERSCCEERVECCCKCSQARRPSCRQERPKCPCERRSACNCYRDDNYGMGGYCDGNQ